MSIAQVPVGKLISKGKRGEVHDYSHLSPSPDYQLHVHQSTTIPGKHVLEVQIHHKGQQIGEVTGSVHKGTLVMSNAEIFPKFRAAHMGRGLGKAANLALMTHGHALGARQVVGDGHTEDSARVYRSLSRTHGLNYNAPKTGRLYGAYRYTLKSEDQDTKMSKVCRCSAYTFPHREKGGKCAPNARHRVKSALESKPDASGDVSKSQDDLGHLLQAARLVIALRKAAEPSWPGHGALPKFDIHPGLHQEAKEYMQSQGMTHEPLTQPPPVDFEHHKKISNAYDSMPHNPNDPNVQKSYGALKKETKAQFDFLKGKGYKFVSTPQPQEHEANAIIHGIRNNKAAEVFNGGTLPPGHPLAEPTGDQEFPTYNDMFRAVHDVFGHARIGADFGQHGEDYAWKSHASMYSPEALPALTNETRGQATNFHFGKNRAYNYANPDKAIFPDQKANLLPEWAHR